MKITIPLNINVSLGAARSASSLGYSVSPAVGHDRLVESLSRREIMLQGLYSLSGYDADFLGVDGERVDLPVLTELGENSVAPVTDSDAELRYHNFSVIMHKERRLALYTAANVDWRIDLREIDGRVPVREELNSGAKWIEDPRISSEHQLPELFFDEDRRGPELRSSFDKGHVVERSSVAWGQNYEQMALANRNTFFTTNCSPQTRDFNQSTRDVLNWRSLEQLISSEQNHEKLCVFAGPVLAPDDVIFRGVDTRGTVEIKIPAAYWKIVVARGTNGPEVFGFMLEQDLSETDVEFAVSEKWTIHQRSIEQIEEKLVGLIDLSWFKTFDQLGVNN